MALINTGNAFFRETSRMIRRAILLLIVTIVALSLFGCNTARGLKDDVIYIGDKTAEILNKPETLD